MSNLATIVNNILADSGIDDINVVVTTGSYTNPAWIVSLPWTKITGTPTTLAGYGITDAYTQTQVNTLLNAKQNTLTLTTTGTSGAATLVGATLNIPQYQSVLTNPVTGAGTQNYLSKWSITGSSLTNSQIFDNGTNVAIGTNDFGADGLSLTNGSNLSFSEGAGTSYANIFRQRNSAATIIAHSLKRSTTSGFASSIGVSVAKAAIAVGYNNGSIAFFSDASSAVANGTDFSPSERVTIINDGSVGFNNPTPTAQLHIRSGGSYTNTDANNRIIVERDAHTYLLFVSPNEFDQGIHFAKTTGIVGRIAYHQRAAGDFMSFTVASAIRMQLFDTGNLYVGSSPSDAGFRLDVNGTSRFQAISTFTGTTVAANGSINIDSADPAIRFRYTGGTPNARIYEWRGVAGGGVNDRMELRLWNDAQTSVSVLFTVSPTGAGTFTSSVTSTGLIVNGTEFYYAPANYASGGFTRLLGRNASTGRIEGMSAADIQAFIGLSSYVSGSGTTNYLPKFTGASTIGNSQIFDNGTNVGIGNVTPNRKFLVQEAGTSTSGNVIGVRNDNSTSGAYINFIAGGGNAPSIGAKGNDITFTADGYGGTELLRVTGTGNLGLSVTPPSWSTFKAINIFGGSFSTNSLVGGGVVIARNWYFDGGEKYFENGTAQRLELVSNGFFFQTAITNSSGAGAALTWVSQMTLNSAGNLLLNTTDDNGAKLQVGGLVAINSDSGGSALRLIGRAAADASAIRFFANNNSTQNARVESNSSEFEINSISNLPITFKTNDTTRLTIAASTGAATFSSTIRSNNTFGLGIGDIAGYRRIQYDNSGTRFGFLTDANSLADIEARKAFFSTTGSTDSTTALLANASTNDSTTYAALFGSLNAGYRMVVRADGNIGMGINTPAVLLDIQRNLAGTGLGDGILFKLKNTSTTANTRSGITFGNIDGIGGSLAMQSAILKNAATGEYDMIWDMYGGAAGWQEGILYIDSNPGRIGIGTTTPGTKLEIVSRAADADRTIPHNVLTITALQGNAPYGFFGGSILFKNSSYVTGVVESARIRSVIYDDGAPFNFGGGIWFETTPTPGGALTPSLVINYQGRVAIGSQAPVTKLHVVNDVTINDALGLLLVENTNTSSGTSSTNSAVNIRNFHGTSQFMQWQNFGIRLGSRLLTNGGAGDLYLTTGTDSVAMTLRANGNIQIGGTFADNGYKFQNAGSSVLAGQVVQGGGAPRSTAGTTIAFTGGSQTVWTANSDPGDGGRFFSIVNESSSTNAFSAVSFRVNPGGANTGNAMLDIKFVNNGSNTSALYWTFSTSGGFLDRMILTNAGNLTATAFFESSDARLKSNIFDLDVDVSSIIAKTYLKNGVEEIGYLAQDVESILPSAISKRKDGYLDLSYRQVHTAKIAYLEKRITELEQQLKNN
jgi:hypothetical protein